MGKIFPMIPDVSNKPAQAKPAANLPSGVLLLSGFEKVVDELIAEKMKIIEATKALDSMRVAVDQAAEQLRVKKEGDGVFSKTVHVKGTAINAVLTFKDAYSKIDPSVESNLRQLLWDNYERLFEKKLIYSIKAEKIEVIKNLVQNLFGEEGINEFFEKEEFIKPVEGFREVRFNTRSELTPDQNAALDEVVQQIADRPTLNFK